MHSLLGQGLAYHQAGRLAEAERCYRTLLQQNPNDPNALHLLGMVAQAVNEHESAVQLIRRAIAISPGVAMFHNNLGAALRRMGDLPAARESYRRAVQLQPDYPEAWANLGTLLRDQTRLVDSLAAYEQALRRRDLPAIRAAMATTLRDMGRIEEAIEHYRRALAADPTMADQHANLCFTLHASDRVTPQEIFDEHVAWARRHADSLTAWAPPHENDRDPQRRLRIGYVSADLRDHAVAKFLAPLLDHRNRERFEVICYSGVSRPDAVTASIQSRADGWREIASLTDAQLADLIRRDCIDVLVDLAGHTNGTRLLAFARKPSPVQFTYLGYPDSSGMTAMDWRISDAVADPPGMTDRWHTEQIARVDGCFLAYPLPPDLPPLTPPPAMNGGFVTFGSFNNLSKISPATLALWRDVLSAVPASRMLIKASMFEDPATRDLSARRVADAGLPMDRVQLLPPVRGQNTHLETYARIDIALDTFPYNGTTTTCEALAMGVPVISLYGSHHVSRVSLSLLSAAGFPRWATDKPQRFIEIACDLAADVSTLAELRGGMRRRLEASALCDGVRLTRGVEEVYRNAWRRWCVGEAKENCPHGH